MSELDDLLNEMLAESEAAINGQSTISPSANKSITFQEDQILNDGNNNGMAMAEKRKSRLSQHHQNEGGFDYLDTLLNDMSDESIRNSIKTDNSRIKSLRLTTTFDLESTLKDLEETFMKDSAIQNKRKPSAYLSKNLSPPPSQQPTISPPPAAPSVTTPPPPVSISSSEPISSETISAEASLQQEPISSPEQQSVDLSISTGPVLKRVSSERAIILTKEAIDTADLLDEMIESFGGVSEQLPPPPSHLVTPTPSAPVRPVSTRNIKSPNSTLTMTRPASKLGAPVDIQVSSPKEPTPIPTLSSSPPPVSPISQQQNSDQLLEDMINHFKENSTMIRQNPSNMNIDPNAPKLGYISQQHYPLTQEEQVLSAKVKVNQTPDEDIVSRILGDNDIDENGLSKSNDDQEQPHPHQDKSWYIKSQPTDVIGSGNNGTTQRGGIHKEKRIVVKNWNFITPQATPILFNEIEQLISIKHPNILPLIGASFDNNNFQTCSEYITGSNLDIAIKNLDERNELQLIIRLSEEIANAMAFLHSFNIVHRSLHPKNILLNSDLKVYIKDYGFTSLKDETLKKKLMTPLKNQILHSQYLAPELFNVLNGGKGGYDTKVDVFSFGVILWEMFARETKLSDLKSNTVNGYTHYLRPTHPNCPFAIEKLIRLCLSTDPNVRPSFITILKVLRQPLHTILKFIKPTQEEQPSQFISSSDQFEQENAQYEIEQKIKNGFIPKPTKATNPSLDQEKREKIQKISNVVKGLIEEPTLMNLNKASQTIDALCKNTENIDYLIDTDFIPLIFQLMDQPYDETQLACLRQFSIIAENNKDIHDIFRNLLGINLLIGTIASHNENIAFSSLRLLTLLLHKEENRIDFLNKGGLSTMINLLAHHNEMLRLQNVWCLSILLDSIPAQNELVQLGGVNPLIDMFVHSENSGFDLRVGTALARVISFKNVQDQINSGTYRERLVNKYVSLLGNGEYQQLRMIALEALACLVSFKDNQNILIENDIVTLLEEHLDLNSIEAPPQMTALKIILLLSVNPNHIPYLKSSKLRFSLEQLLNSPHPAIQKASEKILLFISN
ncbi:hypothetical protein DICPUDRAFT_78414 [Dictyostelium purpureum]|uniref:Protein kinase domain-containing protein n=1 Tax=Dictyostelium purpureum TaxID=5786 RepID=F0ZJH2_DICPU|nr:uncharacterized protein DICPUDRAFT_78414 [Dictyostelium purpureum]EGC35899.1 hypothetical protein DICPUDRAFT_78414 [Dictyostelium purpureum]|eukprot:XP_003287553.1 hypothetical protein DICPUDRAFT_78414 [Dictyostelium purpureum]